jgi:hypothetical protein
MTIKLSQVRPGSKVIIRADVGVGSSIEGKVTNVESNIKNGMPGIDYVSKDGKKLWAYLSQIANVVKF